ncbi:MAG: hypothetical protein R6U36_04510 [Candidatus Fermentibacteraceae bacterium]
MRRPFVLLAVALLAAGCGGKADYDIAEVAPDEHLSGEHGNHHQGHDHGGDDVERDISGAVENRHHHEPGVRNHGTQWFFNQPWAAPFIWDKIVRDSVILLVLAAAVLLFSRLTGRRWQR